MGLVRLAACGPSPTAPLTLIRGQLVPAQFRARFGAMKIAGVRCAGAEAWSKSGRGGAFDPQRGKGGHGMQCYGSPTATMPDLTRELSELSRAWCVRCDVSSALRPKISVKFERCLPVRAGFEAEPMGRRRCRLRQPGAGKLAPLEDAPGSYVTVRASE
jgi:hypothetical protein